MFTSGMETAFGASTCVAHLRPSLFPGGVGKTWKEGDSRGAGRGIAHALGSHGCTRTEKAGESSLGGTIHETAELVTSAGGTGIAVHVDHADGEHLLGERSPAATALGHAAAGFQLSGPKTS